MKYKKIFYSVFEYEQKVFIIFFAVFFIGFLFGSYSVFLTDSRVNISDYFSSSSFDLFISSIFSNFLFLLLIFLIGYSAIGFPFVFVSILYSGIYLGILVSSFTYQYSYLGCVLASIILFPYILIILASQLFVTFSSARLSAALFNVFKRGTRYISPKTYSGSHFLKFVFFSFSSFIATIFYSFFALPVISKFL